MARVASENGGQARPLNFGSDRTSITLHKSLGKLRARLPFLQKPRYPLRLVKLKVFQPWYEKGLQFTCSQCGNCCTGGPGYVWMSDIELQRLSDHLKLSVDEVKKQHCRKVGRRWSLNEHRNVAGQYDCTFLKEIRVESENGEPAYMKRVCTIYPVRPLQCRTWPFWDGNLASADDWNAAAKRCHGMNDGRKFTQSEIEALRDAKDWPDRPPTSANS